MSERIRKGDFEGGVINDQKDWKSGIKGGRQ